MFQPLSIGNLPLGLIDAGTGNINLTSSGNMLDTNGNLNNLKGTNLNLAAVTGIGALTDYIEVLATNVVATSISGGVFITNGQTTANTPPGWSQGKKVGWGGGNMPPGLAKK